MTLGTAAPLLQRATYSQACSEEIVNPSGAQARSQKVVIKVDPSSGATRLEE